MFQKSIASNYNIQLILYVYYYHVFNYNARKYIKCTYERSLKIGWRYR